MTVPNLRPLSFGEILDGAFTLYRRNFPLFVGTSLVLTLALFAVALVVGGTGTAMALAMPGPMSVLVMVMVAIAIAAVAMMLWGALVWQAAQSYTGKPVSMGEGLSAGGRSAMTLVGATFLGTLCFVVLMVGVLLVSMFFTGIVSALGIPALSVIGVLLTTLLFIASFFFVASLFFAVLPAVVLEEKGPVDAIARSVQLVKGALPRVTGMMVVALVITYLPLMAVLMLTGGFQGALNPAAAQSTGQSTGAVLVEQFLTWVVTMLTTPFLMSVIVLLYYDRRVRTEGLDVQMLTESLTLAGA
jgi:preprotein translocase subunit SecG